MRAVLGQGYGPPESFTLIERDTPTPGPGEVRVAVHVAGISFVDVLIASGGYQAKPSLPLTPGSEYSGVIDALGEGVTGYAVGDRIAGSALSGALAEYKIEPAASVFRVPDAMAFDEAAVFQVSYATAYHALFQRGRLRAGETLLVLGAGGATGFAAVQLGKAMGARVIGLASSEAKRQLALGGGAAAVVDARARDWLDQVKRLTEGKGVDVVFDPVGGPATEAAFRSLGWRGRHLVIGFASGEIPRMPINLPLLEGAEMVGVEIRQFAAREPEHARGNLMDLLELYARRAIAPRIARKYSFACFAEAMRAASRGAEAGRVVVEIR